MELIKFENLDWSQIPNQDNPTFDYKNDPIEGKTRRSQAIIVCKALPYESKSVTEKGYVVIQVPISGHIIRRGLFWNFEDACFFGEALNKNA
ncbi:MAG: hypothetical protein EOP45_22450 [Sphingobacteriaceae bacterium]|nr:MAG: hypothetical protein EOP45_22450 [Sphingobacteriaceae bacterium]